MSSRGVRVAHLFSFSVLSYYVSLLSQFRVVMSIHYDFCIKQCSVCLYLQLFVGGSMSYLRYLCLLANSGGQHIFCCGFVSFVFVLSVSLDYPYSIAPSVFSNVYLQ
jgi:hypothetical protein